MRTIADWSRRWGGLAAMLGGLTYLALNVLIEVYFPDHWAGSPVRLLGGSYAGWSRWLWAPEALLLIGLMGVHAYLLAATGRLGWVGFGLAAAGLALGIIGTVIEFWIYGLLLVPALGEFATGSAGSQLGYNVSGYGTLLLLAGLIVFALASLRAALPWRWRVLPGVVALAFLSIVPALMIGQPMLVFGVYSLAWTLVGYCLWRNPPALSGVPR